MSEPPAVRASPEPGTTPAWLEFVHHDGSPDFLDDACPPLGAEVRLRLHTPPGAPVRQVWLRRAPDGEQTLEPLCPVGGSGPGQLWEIRLCVREPLVHYRFALESSAGTAWLTAAGPSLAEPLDFFDFRLVAGYRGPAWLREAVFYQIFPDRFAPGLAPGARPDDGRRVLPWGARPEPSLPFPEVFYGGDLEGVRRHLDHVQALGAEALYLNPVFAAPSNHRYDTSDYGRVDSMLGGDAALQALAAALRRRGMRYLLDIAPNHCGRSHPWFEAAQADASCPEAAFFRFQRHPEEYACWLGVKTLPKLNYGSAELRRRMFEAEDAVFRRWLRPPYGADGWRVDVANMLGRLGPEQLGPEIARAIRAAVKATRPEAYLLAEHWFDASAHLQGDQYDGAMNYAGFLHPLVWWLTGHDLAAWGQPTRVRSAAPWPTAALLATWRQRLGVLPWALACQQLNLLSSHDTPRIRSRLGGERALLELAVAVQLCFPGVPCVYYGDELGLADDPQLGSRGCMPWETATWDQALLDLHRRLLALRRSSRALQAGSFRFAGAGPDHFACLRTCGAERVLVLAQRSPRPLLAPALPAAQVGLPDGLELEDVLTGGRSRVADGLLRLPDQPRGASVWRAH
ncbi:MAG TPA: alpha-amylase family glycosyl hydrolase [Myxococcota bacterium]|nr:alpha-amylase family glycosyl hydrolase [Myxococcota bacterium]HRY92379.1 alpha-amylase family glycosyl hydrolase [Myxococcota bacterium]